MSLYRPHTTAHLVLLATYNARLNGRMIASCSELDAEQLSADRRGFFGSILAHWNHIMFADLIFLRRLRDARIQPQALLELDTFAKPQSPRDIYHSEFESFSCARCALDQVISIWVATLDTTDLHTQLRYKSTEGDDIQVYVDDLLLHMFMHQVHHRGQISCMLSQCGVDYGCTDLPVIATEGSRGLTPIGGSGGSGSVT